MRANNRADVVVSARGELEIKTNAAQVEQRAGGLARRGGGWLLAWLVVLAALAAWHAPIITSLPYEDQSIALWTEANFLVETGFDFYRLRYHENHFMAPEPGARSYVISVLPSIVALLMIVCPNIETLVVVTHLLTLACTSVIVLLMYAAARPWAGRTGSVLICLMLLTTPLFDVQVQMVGMDLPLAAFALLAATLLWRHHFVWAAVASMGAFFMKATGGLITMTGLVYLLGLLLLGPVARDAAFRRKCLGGLAAHGLALVVQTLLVSIGDESVAMRKLIPWPWILRLPYALMWSPDVGAILLVSITLVGILVVVWLGRSWRARSISTSLPSTREYLFSQLELHRQQFICWTFLGGMLVANWLYIFIPRYFTSAMPFLALAFGSLLLEQLRLRRAGYAVLGGVVVLNLINLDGKLYPEIYALGAPVFDEVPMLHPRSCAFTERSREYLPEHEANIRAMQILDARYPDVPVLVAIPQRYYLMKPRLGYVEAPHPVLQAETFGKAIRNFCDAMVAAEHGAPEPILYWMGRTRATLPPPEPGDEIIYDDGLDPPLVVFRKHFDEPRPQGKAAWEEWYLDKTWPGSWPVDTGFSRSMFLVETGRIDRAIEELSHTIERSSSIEITRRSIEVLEEHLKIQRIIAWADEGEFEKARPAAYEIWLKKQDDPMRLDMIREVERRSLGGQGSSRRGELTAYFPSLVQDDLILARALARLKRFFDSTGAKQFVITSAPTMARSASSKRRAEQQYDLGVRFLRDGSWGESRQHFTAALDLELAAEYIARVHLTLGMLDLAQDRLDDAAGRFRAALEADPEMPEAHNQMGLVYLQQGNLADAQAAFAEAVRLAPLYGDAHNNLGVVLVKRDEPELARAQFDLALRIEPTFETARINRQSVDRRAETP